MTAETKTPLDFSLDPQSGVPYYKQIIFQVEMAMADGRLTSGQQLPTVRSLAVDLQINPNTVARAYMEMEIRGIVNTQQGTGTFISDKSVEITTLEKEKILEEIVRPFLVKIRSYGFSVDEIIAFLKEAEGEKA